MLNGRYGPYITDGKRNARIPKDTDPKSVTLELCRELLAVAPLRGSRFGRKKSANAKDKAPAKDAAPAAADSAEQTKPAKKTAAKSAQKSEGADAAPKKVAAPKKKKTAARAANAKPAASVPKKTSSKPKKKVSKNLSGLCSISWIHAIELSRNAE